METVICNLCGSSHSSILFEIGDFWLERVHECFTYVRCNKCGLVYQNPRPNSIEIVAYYPQEYEVFQSNRHAKYRFLLNYGMHRRSRFITRHKSFGKLLDVGCANGSFLHWMKQYDYWDLYGIEPNQESAESARKHGIQVATGTLEQVAYPPAFFDVLTLWDVVEHLHDPLNTLRELNRIIKPDGVLVMRFPNLDSLDARLFGKYWAGFDAPRHLYVFDNHSMEEMLRLAGFSIFEKSTQVGGYLNFVKSIRFALTGNKISSTIRTPIIRLLSSLPVRIAFSPLFFLKDSGLRGSELIIVAKREVELA